MPYAVFVINPGSTSTKTALFQGDRCLFERTIHHGSDDIARYRTIAEQLPMRLAAVESALLDAVSAAGLEGPEEISAFVGRGGVVRPVASGVYAINAAMCADVTAARYGEHASNLGPLIASSFGERFHRPAYIVDPVTVDELQPVARMTGLPEIKRISRFHALNQKAVARKASADLGSPYESISLVVAHLGGGISVAAHENGKVIDVNDAMNEGPFSADRAGSLPTFPLIDMAFSGQYDRTSLKRRLVGQGGLMALVGTTDCKLVEDLAPVRPDYDAALEGMIYQVAKWIGLMAVVLEGRAKAIVITGGMAKSDYLINRIKKKVSFLAPVLVYPGEAELASLAAGAMRVLEGHEQPGIY